MADGLELRGKTWHINKSIRGRRVRRSTGTCSKQKAKRILAQLIANDFDAVEFGKRPPRTFIQAATKYLQENQHKKGIAKDASLLKALCDYNDGEIASTQLNQLHRGTLDGFVKWKSQQKNRSGDLISATTINHHLKVVRQIVNQAAKDWRDEDYGLTWLESAPKIKLLTENKKPPYPLKRSEQEKLFALLPKHLRRMALFKVNTGTRDQEVCNLRWDWMREIPELSTYVFVVPAELVKNNRKRVVILNSIARSVIEECRDNHETHVFSYRGKPISRMHADGWQKARREAGLPDVRVHDLKHTFGARLRNVGVNHEDRQELLGHTSGNITTHYSAATLDNLIRAAELVVASDETEATVLRL